VPQEDEAMVPRTYAPATETSAQEAMVAAEPATVEADQEVNSPTHVLAGPVAPFGYPA
jgi:hypothetical protein